MSCTTRFSDLSERESALRDAIYARKTSRYARPPLGPYPRRPAAPLPPSRSVDVFRAILHHAPNLHTSDSRVKRHHDMFAGEWCCSWTEEYFSELFAALNDVLHEHGMGNDGWKSFRWEVYDKYSECLGGIQYHRHGQ
ncbi:hypothetical protein L208DRAFT_183539 [Tricholoma matsutake]|nr:hypothetical protein L208DRAFT_183539 [Tricholoma matsutake 945]